MHDYRSKITPTTTTMLLQLFYLCYKQGVSDAADLHDSNRCREYVERMQHGHRFGLVGKDYFIDWVEWRSILYMWAGRKDGIFYRNIANNYLTQVKTYRYYDAVPLRLCMDFYILGVEDYCKYPEPAAMLIVFEGNETYYKRWGKEWSKQSKRRIDHFKNDVILLLNDRKRVDKTLREENHEDNRLTLNERTYENFLDILITIRWDMICKRKALYKKAARARAKAKKESKV